MRVRGESGVGVGVKVELEKCLNVIATGEIENRRAEISKGAKK